MKSFETPNPPILRIRKGNRHTIFFLALVLGVLTWVIWRNSGQPAKDPTLPSSKRDRVTAETAGVEAIQWNSTKSVASDQSSLAALSDRLKGLPKSEAVREIRDYLASSQDAATTLAFEISGNNEITGWPTVRTFLIDLLLQVDPVAAAEISRGILENPTSADEWAIALRNVGRVESGSEANAYLTRKTEELIQHPAWQEKPSIGYLNAFDVLVHTRATASAPLLSDIVRRKDRPDLAHAGFLTLDRLTQLEPATMLQQLSQNSALHQARPEMVAQQFARADLRDLAQQALVKSWLLDPERTAVELRTFAESYPNNNQMVSHNLLTTENPISGADLAGHDREVAAIISGWMKTQEFSDLKPFLQTVSRRLTEFNSLPTPP